MGAVTTDLNRIIAIEEKKDELVKKAEEFFQDRGDNVPIDKNQFENVCRMAMTTESINEIKNFIRYQIGRAKQNEGWQDRDFGKKLVDMIEEIAKLHDEQSVKIGYVRLFLGFWNRHAVYLRSMRPVRQNIERS